MPRPCFFTLYRQNLRHGQTAIVVQSISCWKTLEKLAFYLK